MMFLKLKNKNKTEDENGLKNIDYLDLERMQVSCKQISYVKK